MGNGNRPRAFVIMPFAEEFEPIYQKLIAPALADYDVIRADSRLDQQNILATIVEGIAEADLIIADVTGTNPNVMYELGAAHALGKATVMISQTISNLPFDIRSYQVQAYSTHFAEADDLVRRIREIGEKHSVGLLKFSNPFSDFMPSFRTTRPKPATRPLTDTGRYGFLDHSADMKQYGGQVVGLFGRLGELNKALTADLHVRAPALHEARASKAAGAKSTTKQLTNEVADLIQEYARNIREEVLPPFHEGWDRIGFAMSWLASQKAPNVPPEEIEHFCHQGRELREALSTVAGSVTQVRDIIATGRGLTATLEEAIDEMEQALNGIVSEVMLASALLAAAQERMGCVDVAPSA